MGAIAMIVIVMGVSGSGKTTVGHQLAAALGWRYIEGDDFHPPKNVAKMSRGEPLTDTDRAPWLAALVTEIEHLSASKTSAVVTCSALKQRYRDRLQESSPLTFVYLKGSAATLKSRLVERTGHFMKVNLLENQLATLEEPEEAIIINIDYYKTTKSIVVALQKQLEQANRNN